MKIVAVAILAALALNSQEAKIMIVEKPDSARLLRAYREYKDAAAQWEKLKIEMAAQYTNEKGKPMAGWEKVQFSADFRAIVPDSSPYASHNAIQLTPCGIWTPVNSNSTADTVEINGDLIVHEKK